MATKRKRKQKSKTLKRKQIPKNAYKKYKKYKKIYHGGVGEDDCAICLEEIQEEEVLKTTCDHPFHKKCIVKWFAKNNETCPICRRNLKVLVKSLMQDILDSSVNFEAIKEERQTLNTEIETFITSILDSTLLQNKEDEKQVFINLTTDFKNKLATFLDAAELEQVYDEKIRNQQGIPSKIYNRHKKLRINANFENLSLYRAWHDLNSFLKFYRINLDPIISFNRVPKMLERHKLRATIPVLYNPYTAMQ